MPAEQLREPRILLRESMSEPEVGVVGPGRYAAFSQRSPEKTTDNEDAAILQTLPDGRAVLAVADGLGGHAAGADAAALTLAALQESLQEDLEPGGELRPAMLNGIEAANERVQAMGIGAATTLVAVEIDGNLIRPYHVGDSVLLVIGGRGKLKLQTVAHSPVGYAVEAGVLNEREAINHEHRHVVSNIVGSPDMRIEIGASMVLRPRDTIVLGSDGLFDNLHVAEVIQRVRCGPIAKAARSLMETGRSRMNDPTPGRPSKPDDFTFIVYRPAHPASDRTPGTGDSGPLNT